MSASTGAPSSPKIRSLGHRSLWELPGAAGQRWWEVGTEENSSPSHMLNGLLFYPNLHLLMAEKERAEEPRREAEAAAPQHPRCRQAPIDP